MSTELDEVREKFKNWVVEQGFYPNTVNPVLCYVLDVELGLDPREMPMEQTITKKTYEVFIFEPGGKKLVRDKDYNPLVVTRKFTAQQQQKLRKWWPVLFGVEYV